MRRIRYDRTLTARIDDARAPEPGAQEVLVRVATVGLTLPGVRMLRELPPDAAVSPGGEVGGEVAAVGEGVANVRVGDRVVGLSFGAAHAELAVVPAALATPIPEDVGTATAVATLRGGQVALGVLAAGRLAAGESVLVTAAAGAIGHLAVQLARAAGAARIVGAIGAGDGAAGQAKAAFVTGLGADEVVAYDDMDGVEPVDVVLDGAGGDVLRRGVEALAPLGRVVSFSAPGGDVAANTLRDRGASLIGFQMALVARRFPEVYARRCHELWQALAGGRLRPAIHAELPFTRATEAHLLLAERRNLGKVLLRPV